MNHQINLNQSGHTDTSDRREMGGTRPDRFSQKKSGILRRHVWGAAATIVVCLSVSGAELSGGYVSNLFAGEKLGTPFANSNNTVGQSRVSKKYPTRSVVRTPRNGYPARSASEKSEMALIDASSCPRKPRVEMWGALTHEREINYFKRRYGNNWAVYLDK